MIVWIQNPFDSLPTEGSRKQRFWLMAEAFAAAGHAVVYWTSDFSHARKGPRRPQAKPNGGFEVRFLPTLPYRKNVSWKRVRSHRAYAEEWKREAVACVTADPAERPDVVISSIPSISAAEVGLGLARRFGARFVLDVMDAWPETFERLAPRGGRWLAKLLLTPLRRRVRRLYRAADLVTGVCERYRELTGREDYCLAYHGIEEEKRDEGGRKRNEGRVRLAYVGNLGKSYDLKTVVEAVKANGDFELDVAGFGAQEASLQAAGRACPRIRFHGLLDRERLGALLAECDVGVIPMKPDSWVGLPYKLCDYLVAGLHVVSSLGGESGRLLAAYRCGVGYVPGDARSLADAVRQAQKLPPEAGRRLVREKLAADVVYASYCRRVSEVGLR